MADTAYQDLLKDTSESKENGNYFLVTITDLEPNKSYPIQFRWMYKDKRINDNWSAVKLITTPGESEPNTPAFSASNVDVSSPEKIIITWDGTSDDGGGVQVTNYDRVDVYIDGAPFDGTKAAYSFKAPGTATISAPAGTYQIVLYAVSKTGKLSPVSSAVTKTVTAAGVAIQTPTLPSGLSVATAPFAITVNWNGAYSSSTFTGFKSIDIYAVSSDLGSSVTSGISSSNLVGSLTVNDTTNRINVGLDNLRQALGLSNNSDVYSATIFYYYNAVNLSNQKYGSPTYTRINSTSVVPTKANYVDLASGVISIEHLEAGNGTFASWLRAGSAGGSRIELSAVNDFTDNGYTVQKGLVAYSSGNTEIFNLDTAAGTLTINGSGTFTGDLSAGSGNSIFKADSSGIYLGNASYASAPFSVSRNGILKAESGTIGGWTLGSTYLQGNNLKLDTSGIVVGSTSNKYLDISPSGIILRNSNGTDAGIFTLTTGSSASLSISGTFSINASSTIDGTAASTVKSGAASGASALQPSGTLTGAVSASATIDGTAASTVKSGASSGASAVQPGNGMSVDSGTKQVNQILLNSSGIGIYTATTGTRMQLTNSGLELYNGTTRNVYLNGATGNAEFTGTVNASGGNFTGYVTVGSMKFGIDVNSTNDGIYINSNNYWYDGGIFKVGDGTKNLSWDGSSLTIVGTINADSGRIGSATTGWTIDTDGTLHNGTGTYIFPSANSTSVGGGSGSSNNLSYYSNRGVMVFPGTASPYGYTAIGTDFVTYSGTSPHISSNSNIRINDAFAPNSDNTYSLGFTTARWQIVRSAGGVSTSSDERMKTDIKNSELGLNFIKALRPVSYKFISGGKVYKDGKQKEVIDGAIVEPELIDKPGIRTHWGFIAQEVKEAIDSCGVDDFAGWQLDDKDDPNSQQSLVHHQFIGPITKAIQELAIKLENIEKRLDALKA